MKLIQRQVQKQKQKMKAAIKYIAIGTGCAALLGGIAFTYLNLGQSENARAGVNVKDPVKLRYFEAEPMGETVSIKWRTLIENESDHFTIERSDDGKMYEPIAVVQGAGFSENRKDYNFIDSDPLPGSNFYRLGKTNFQGETVYSDPLLVVINKVFPVKLISGGANKINGTTELIFESDTNADVTVKLTSITGQTVFSDMIKPAKGRNVYTFESKAQLPGGVYTAVVEQGSIKSNPIKIVKAE